MASNKQWAVIGLLALVVVASNPANGPFSLIGQLLGTVGVGWGIATLWNRRGAVGIGQ